MKHMIGDHGRYSSMIARTSAHGLRENGGVDESERVDDDAAFMKAALIFGNVVRQQILRHLLVAGSQNQSQTSEAIDLPPNTVTRQLGELEEFGVIVVDLPRGSRQGRAANYWIDVPVYEALLEGWVSQMRPLRD